jgi:hypothetical protein
MATTVTQAVVSTVATPAIINADSSDTTALQEALLALAEGLGVSLPSGFALTGFSFSLNPDGTSVTFVPFTDT